MNRTAPSDYEKDRKWVFWIWIFEINYWNHLVATSDLNWSIHLNRNSFSFLFTKFFSPNDIHFSVNLSSHPVPKLNENEILLYSLNTNHNQVMNFLYLFTYEIRNMEGIDPWKYWKRGINDTHVSLGNGIELRDLCVKQIAF